MDLEFILRLTLSGLLGALIGWERKNRDKEAGLRTHFVVAMGSALIMLVSKYGFSDMLHEPGVVLDPSRVAAQVVSGIGFLGAGTIIVQRLSVRGLTTAAGLWATSGIGLAIGAGMYVAGIAATALVLIALELLNRKRKLSIVKTKRVEVRALNVNTVFAALNELEVKMLKLRMTNEAASTEKPEVVLSFHVRTWGSANEQTVLATLQQLSGVLSVHVE